MSEKYEPWVCDHCTAACTFEAMEWCAKRWDPSAECGYDKDQPLAMDKNGVPSREGYFEFVQLKRKARYEGKVFASISEQVLRYLEQHGEKQ